MNLTYDTLYEFRVIKKMTYKQIEELTGIKADKVKYTANKLKIPKIKVPKAKKEDSIDINEVLELIQRGYLVGDVAQHFNVNRNTIKRLLGANGYNMRNNKNQVNRQREMMLSDKNPTKGTTRPRYVIDAMQNNRRLAATSKWLSISDYKTYAKTCRYIAKTKINEVPKGYAIDHIVSIKDCWENNLPVTIASNINNLQIIDSKANLKKGSSSSMSIEELLSKIINSTTIETVPRV